MLQFAFLSRMASRADGARWCPMLLEKKMKFHWIAGALAIGLALPALAQRGPQGPQTRADFETMQKSQFDHLDTNHDGVLTKAEFVAAITARMGTTPPDQLIDMMFKRLDTDGDGKATAAEVQAHDLARFDQWDTNHDGQLSRDEMIAGRQALDRAAPKP